MKKEFNLDEIEIMPGDILIRKEVPQTKLILSPQVVEKLVRENEFEVYKVGAGVNYLDINKNENEENVPIFKKGMLVYLQNFGDGGGFTGVEGDKKYICFIISSSSIKFIFNKK